MDSLSQRIGPILGILGALLIAGALTAYAFFQANTAVMLLAGGVGIVLVAIYIFTRPREELREAVTGRTAVYGGNAVLMSVIFILIVGLINYLAGQQLHLRWDLTGNQQHTLSQQTINVLKGLQDPVQVVGFFTPPNVQSQTQAQALLKDYSYQTNKLNVQFIDPVANPGAAKQYDIQQDGTLVFIHGARNEKVYTFDESTFTNSILKVTQAQQPAIYFTTGHGEMAPSDNGQSGLSTVSNFLAQTNYKVDVLNLAAITATETISGGLPANTTALVIADPVKPFAPQDEAKLKAYLQSGGRVLLMVNPQSDPGLKDLLATYGLTLNNDLVLDPQLNYRGFAAYPVVTSFPSHAVTQNLQSYGVFFPGARSLAKAAGTDKTPDALFTTSDQACGKTDLAALKNQTDLTCNPGTDEKGPFTLGYAEEIPATGSAKQATRLIVVGNSTFASNQVLGSPDGVGDGQLLQNMVTWLAGQEDLIAVPPKAAGSFPLKATSNQDVFFIALSTAAIIPLALLVIGGLIWWKRR